MEESYFDHDLKFDSDNWAVTLLKGKKNNHAQIIVEGVDENNLKFSHQAHFVGPYSSREGMEYRCFAGHGYKGQIKDFKPADLKKYQFGSTATCIRSKEKVKKMMEAVHEEYLRQQNEEKHIRFNILGKHSFFASVNWESHKNVFGTLSVGTLLGGILVAGTGLPPEIPSFIYSSILTGLSLWVAEETRRNYKSAHSCITWSQEKLVLADIFVDFSSLQFLVSHTEEAINKLRKREINNIDSTRPTKKANFTP